MPKPKKDPIEISFARCDNPDCEAFHLQIEGEFLGDINIPMTPDNWRNVIALIEAELDRAVGKPH